MEHITQIVIAIFASTGFWALVQAVVLRIMDRRSAERAALLGLLHERLVEQCESYLDRGYATEGEIRDLEEYIYTPYRNLGGNGTGEQMFDKTRELIFRGKDSGKS